MYLLKHSRPKLSNCIRELTKTLGVANEEHMREMRRIIHYVLKSKKKGLRMKPKITRDKEGNIRYIIKGICNAA